MFSYQLLMTQGCNVLLNRDLTDRRCRHK